MENPFISLESIKRFLENLSVNAIMKEDGKGLSSNDLTHLLKAQYDQAYNHALSPHAPTNAQENLIERIQVNGSLLTIVNKTADIPIPTHLSQLANDVGYMAGHPSVNISPDINSERVLNYGQTFTAVKTVIRDSNGHVRRIDTETLLLPQEYLHPESPVSPGSFKNVTVNRYGHVISGTNPTTRDGFGLVDVMTRNEVQQSIKEAISAAEGLTRSIVTALPSISDADNNKIYLVLRSTTSIGGAVNNIYEEFMVINGKWEKIGDTSVDLDGYLHIDRYQEITNLDIDSMFTALPEAGRQILNIVGTGYLVKKLKEMIDTKASGTHDHGGLVTVTEATNGTLEETRLWSPERVARAIRGVPLTGLNVVGGSSTPVAASDSFLKGIERLQSQINSLRSGSELLNNNFNLHIQDKFNPHEVTIDQIGAAALNHTHDNTDLINALTLAQLPTSNQANVILRIGSANSTPMYGKLQLTTDVAGVLPIANGGTGANNAPGARANLGITLENLGAAAAVHKHEVSDLLTNQRLGSNLLPTSLEGNRVLAVISPNANPEYTQINDKMLLDNIIKNQHLVDRTITSVKLQENLFLAGVPTADTPILTDRSTRLATTKFVQDFVEGFSVDFIKPGPDGKLALSLLPEHSYAHTHPVSDVYGVVPVAQIPNLDASKITSGRFTLGRLPTASNGNRILKVWNAYSDPDWGQVNLETDVTGVLPANNIGNIDASKVTSGIFDVARIPNLSATKITSDRLDLGRLPTSLTANRLLRVGTANTDPVWAQVALATDVTGRLALANLPLSGTANRVLRTGTANSDPVWGQVVLSTDVFGVLPAANIGDLDASKITSGIFNVARIPDLDAAKITTGAFHVDRIPGLDAAKIISGAFHVDRIPNHSANKITSDRLTLTRLPTSSTANRILRVGTVNTDPTWSQVALESDVSGQLPITNGGTNAADAATARANLGITLANLGAAASSHGNHVPTIEAANNTRFLRNDNTFQAVTPANIGAALSTHYHDAADITSGRLALTRTPTSATANRVLRVATANGDPSYGQVVLTTDVSGILPQGNGGTGYSTLSAALAALPNI